MPRSNKKKKNPVKEKNKIISTSFHEAQGLAYQIIRKKIKSMRLTVLAPDGRVRVSAPSEILDSTVEKFVLSKREWIEKHQERLRNIPKSSVLTERKYISGEPFFLFGKMYVLEVEENKDKNSFSLEIDGELAKFTVRSGSDATARESFVREWYRVLLKEKIEELLPEWEKITGLYCNSWHTKFMTTRWGTCNSSDRRIWLNLQLAKKPTECLEYVILHELAHLKVHNHGKNFVAIMDRYIPDWRNMKKMLNEPSFGYLEPHMKNLK